MRYLFSLLLMLAASPVFAVICKSIDAQGVVSFSDVPAADCAHQVKLPKPTVYTPPALPAETGSSDVARPQPGRVDKYVSMTIVQPANDGTVRDNEGKVPVSVALDPTLKPGDKIRVLLDGVMVQPAFSSQSGVLGGVDRGTHTLAAEVVDGSGRVLIRAASVTFTLHQASILNRERLEKKQNKTGSGAVSAP